jgi:hypothetical protein
MPIRRRMCCPAGQRIIFDMVGFDMVGFDMVGFDMVGFDMVGFDMVGFDMVGDAFCCAETHPTLG